MMRLAGLALRRRSRLNSNVRPQDNHLLRPKEQHATRGSQNMEIDPRALEEFKQLIELLRFYTNLVLQTVTFVLTATSAVVAYAIKEPIEPSRVRYGYAIPAVLCFGMGVGFLLNILPAIELIDRLRALSQVLKFGLAPHGNILIGALAFFGGVLTMVGIILGVLFARARCGKHSQPSH
jgi:hypothetical protein